MPTFDGAKAPLDLSARGSTAQPVVKKAFLGTLAPLAPSAGGGGGSSTVSRMMRPFLAVFR